MDYLLYGIAVIFGVWLLMRVVSSLFRILFVVLLLGVAYYFFTGRNVAENVDLGGLSFFTDNNINQLMADNCHSVRADDDKSVKCECMITPVYNDMKQRLGGAAQVRALDKSKLQMNSEMSKSFYNQSANIKACLNRKKEEQLSIVRQIINFFSGK